MKKPLNDILESSVDKTVLQILLFDRITEKRFWNQDKNCYGWCGIKGLFKSKKMELISRKYTSRFRIQKESWKKHFNRNYIQI